MGQVLQLFSKPLDSVTRKDLDVLVKEGVPEGDHVEFKEKLPAKEGKKNPWDSGGANIGERARNEILEEAVAFANAHGGHILVGIAESEDKPPRAVKISPVQRCAELAERLRLQARDCIDPQLPITHTVGVETDDKGSGVVVIRVPESRLAPHRLIPTKECYFRRADRSEKMTMREIQDLTLNRQRGLEGVDRRFQDLRENFRIRVQEMLTRSNRAVGMTARAVPVSGQLFVERVFNNPDVRPEFRSYQARLGKSGLFWLRKELAGFRENRPILRGSRSSYDYKNLLDVQETFCDGALAMESVTGFAEKEEPSIDSKQLLALVVDTVLSAHKFRVAAGAPDVEYGLEVQVGFGPGQVSVIGLHSYPNQPLGKIDGDLDFPRYSVGPTEEFNQLFSAVILDLWHSTGHDLPDGHDSLVVNFEDALPQVVH